MKQNPTTPKAAVDTVDVPIDVPIERPVVTQTQNQQPLAQSQPAASYHHQAPTVPYAGEHSQVLQSLPGLHGPIEVE